MSIASRRPPAPFAPWGKIVPGHGPVTVDILLTLPDDGQRYEVVEGVLIRMAGSGDEATSIGIEFAAELRNYVRPRRLGRVTGADGVYKFPGAETCLLPDVGFYIVERRALIRDRTKPIPFAPDLAVEVASPDQTAADMAAKAQRYLRGGTRLVWVLWPRGEHIDLWRPADLQPDYRDMRPAATLGAGDLLDGEDVVPGFSLSVADVFADPLD